MTRLTGLIILTVLFILSGCAPDQYSVEKEYWKEKRLKDMATSNPLGSTGTDVERAVKALGDFSRKYPKNQLAIEADLDIATLYMAKNEYGKAREQLRGIINDHAPSQLICSEALFLIGHSYQIEGKWDAALLEYRKLIRDYPQTTRGLDMPIYIAQNYKSKGELKKMTSAYKEAIEYYTQLSLQHPDSQLAFYASRSAGRCYMELKDWPRALSVFQKILVAYRGKVELDDILMNQSIIYAQELNNKDKAAEALEQLIKNYPNSKFLKAAEFMLREWNRL